MILKSHLGCGSNVMPDWENMDSNPSPGAGLWTAPWLPYFPNEVDFIYHEHFIEHLPRPMADQLFKEAMRCLKPGGVMRVSTPDLATIVEDYTSNSPRELNEKYGLVGFTNNTQAEFINRSFRDWEHKFIYDEEEFYVLGELAGFSSCNRVRYRDSIYPDLRNLECRPDFGDLIMEFIK